ncbi:MAG: PAS domain S-box protein, partial [Halobacteriales archaeon]|nr:PAS domain S-box protein [Halobacteriales archaeon]
MTNEIRVLNVDDEPDYADLTAQYLSREDEQITVEVASDAEEALEVIQTHSIDCVVSDYDMPGMNGIDLLAEVRERHPDLPFILYTGKGSEEIASEAISAGVTDYLQKRPGPDQSVILANRIENAVAKARAERRAEDAYGLYRSLAEDALDTSEVGTIILDSNFYVVWINSAIETYFGIDRDEVIGESKRALIDSHIASIFEAPEAFAQTVTATYDDNTGVEEFECHILPAGERHERWLRHWSQPIEAGRFAGGRIEHYTDITEYKEREREIARLNELHETVLANIRDAVFLTDDDGRFTYICPNVEYIFGYDRDDVADIGTIQALLGERLVKAEALAERGEIHNIEVTTENHAGEPRQLLVTASTVEIEEGSQLYSIRDITDRADRERAYQELSRRHELALEATDTGVWEWNMETDEVVWTEALERLMGLEPGEFGGTFDAYAEFLHPDAVGTIEHAVETALVGSGVFDEEFRMIREDGEVIWVHGQGKIFSDDGPRRMLGITTDITDRKAQEVTLREEQQFIETAINTLNDIFYVITPDGEFIRWNHELPAVTGYTDAEIGGMNALDLFEGDDIERIQGFFEEVVETGEAVVEVELVTKDGESIPHSSRASRLHHADGELAGITGISRDVTDRLEREQRLERQNERLEEFAQIVSHDLRNPLAVAQGRLELVREEHESESLDAIARAHDRMNVLIEDLLTLAREGEAVKDVERVDLDELAEECWLTVNRAAARLEVDSGLRIEADRSRLKQLIENLFRNAIEHGGEDVTISLGAVESGFYLEDDGPGIPEDEREAVLSPGFTTSETGTGYGLSIVAEVVEAHGWDIRVTEGAGGG